MAAKEDSDTLPIRISLEFDRRGRRGTPEMIWIQILKRIEFKRDRVGGWGPPERIWMIAKPSGKENEKINRKTTTKAKAAPTHPASRAPGLVFTQG